MARAGPDHAAAREAVRQIATGDTLEAREAGRDAYIEAMGGLPPDPDACYEPDRDPEYDRDPG